MIASGAETHIPERLKEMLEIEQRISLEAAWMATGPWNDHVATDLLAEAARAAATHAQRIEGRLIAFGFLPAESPAFRPGDRMPERASDALRRLFTLLSEAVVGYAALAPIANRFRDSAISAPNGMTGHVARDNSQQHLALMGRIGGAIQAIVIRELKRDGLECQCICPACGLGLCVCGLGARAGFNEAWLASRPVPDDTDLTLPAPRATSAAAASGFLEGDRLVAGDEAVLSSYPQLQTTIKAHEMGDKLTFEVERAGNRRKISVTRTADIGDGTLPLDCEAPAGSAFYLDRARDLRQRLRKRTRTGQAPKGIGELTVRETQVLRLVADGATNPMIGAKLRISRPTVARHVANILMKLEVSNRSEAAALAALNGLSTD